MSYIGQLGVLKYSLSNKDEYGSILTLICPKGLNEFKELIKIDRTRWITHKDTKETD